MTKGVFLMTNREAYVFGWVYGRICAESKNQPSPNNIAFASARPYYGNAQIITAAHRDRVITPELDAQLAEALSEIDSVEIPMQGGSEKVQPLELQGTWHLGYYAGMSKRPLAAEAFDIEAARRAKGMTQKQLAAALGVDQPTISRWESGRISPNKNSLSKIKEVLL